jgi:hypothetical protein
MLDGEQCGQHAGIVHNYHVGALPLKCSLSGRLDPGEEVLLTSSSWAYPLISRTSKTIGILSLSGHLARAFP